MVGRVGVLARWREEACTTCKVYLCVRACPIIVQAISLPSFWSISQSELVPVMASCGFCVAVGLSRLVSWLHFALTLTLKAQQVHVALLSHAPSRCRLHFALTLTWQVQLGVWCPLTPPPGAWRPLAGRPSSDRPRPLRFPFLAASVSAHPPVRARAWFSTAAHCRMTCPFMNIYVLRGICGEKPY